MAACDIAFLRATPGGDELSPAMLLILSFVVYDGYELFPAAPPAKRLGSELSAIGGQCNEVNRS